MTKFALILIAAAIAGCATTPTRTVHHYGNAPIYATQTQPVYTTQSQPVYASVPAPQEDYNKKVIKQGLMGAATGAIAAEVSGGKAGTGALVGAGTNVLGGALFDMLTTPQAQPQPQYVPYVNQYNEQNPNARVVRKYDSNGNVVSEEVFTR